MPRVPVLDSQVAPQRLSIPRAQDPFTESDFGAGIAQGGLRLASGLQDFQNRRDESASKRAAMNFSTVARQIDSEFLALQGEDVVEQLPQFIERYEEARRVTGQDLRTARAREAYNLTTQNILNQRFSKMDAHVLSVQDQLDDAASESVIQEHLEIVSHDADDPTQVEFSLQRILAETRRVAERKGMGDAELDQLLRDRESDVHAAVTKSLLVTQPHEGRAYFQENKSKINSKERLTLENSVKTANDKRRSQLLSDRIWGDGSKTDEQLLEEARKIPDPDERDNTLARVKVRIAERKAITAARQQEVDDEYMRQVVNNPHDVSLLDAPPEVSPKIVADARAMLLNDYQDRTDAEVFGELVRMRITDPAAFRDDLNLWKFRGYFSDRAVFNELLAEQNRMRSGGKQTPLIGRLQRARIIMANAYNVNRKDKQDELLLRITEEELRTPIESEEEFDRFIHYHMTNVVTNENAFWFDQSTRRVEVDESTQWGDIPKADRDEIIRRLQQRSQPYDEQAVRDVWVEWNTNFRKADEAGFEGKNQ